MTPFTKYISSHEKRKGQFVCRFAVLRCRVSSVRFRRLRYTPPRSHFREMRYSSDRRVTTAYPRGAVQAWAASTKCSSVGKTLDGGGGQAELRTLLIMKGWSRRGRLLGGAARKFLYTRFQQFNYTGDANLPFNAALWKYGVWGALAKRWVAIASPGFFRLAKSCASRENSTARWLESTPPCQGFELKF